MWNQSGYHNGPYNLYSYYIGYNPPTSVNPHPKFPSIHNHVFLSPFTFVAGDVTIQKNTYIGPFVSIRADEGTPFYIGRNSNLQDGVILHGLKNKYFEKNSKMYSIYIGNRVSCAHGALVHGPCRVDDDVFIGFKAIVYNAIIGEGSYISSGAVVTNGVELKPNSFVPPGANVDTQEKANVLAAVPKTEEEFAKEVQRVNSEFPATYSLYFGKNKCSCGLAC
ncbi:carbonate dehydratase [Bacillus sp. EB106-08-02-XG196]|uniref:carbonate dehydratase n=1 Tax=Bacillus sp. EB106-08-02-XG196 TaxID=2737049 RepID=UPI0015C4C7DF|nr:carbonate dehydratase [Bacillus sp. EB106-08-02-XG196]NWQ41461.1 carbonate dehydratase [Bacillus sp. EB106-08-02-XG196]